MKKFKRYYGFKRKIMKITKIEIQKKIKDRVNLYIDEEFYCGLSLETIMKFHLKENQELSPEQLDFLKNNTEKEVATNKAIKFISKVQKTKKEVFDYLLKKGYEKELCDCVIAKLEEYKFIDDEQYIKNFTKFKCKHNGSRKIINELNLKGLDKEKCEETVNELANDKVSIKAVLDKYLKNKERNFKTKQKAYRFLSSKGYNYEDINEIINKFFKEDSQNEDWN